MRIAFISFEYPPDTSHGGIATYVRYAAQMLAKRGHDVEVFAGSMTRDGSVVEAGVTVHRVQGDTHEEFRLRVGPRFARRYGELGFDVLEGPDVGADAAGACELVPDIPFVLKLHTPGFLLDRANLGRLSLWRKARVWLGAKHKGVQPFYRYDRSSCAEYQHSLRADEVAAPSRSIGDIVAKEWGVGDRLSYFPLPFSPSQAFVSVPPGSSSKVVLFVGRLEPRKGIYELARIIPKILTRHPDAEFWFLGRAIVPRGAQEDTRTTLERQLGEAGRRVKFLGGVPLV